MVSYSRQLPMSNETSPYTTVCQPAVRHWFAPPEHPFLFFVLLSAEQKGLTAEAEVGLSMDKRCCRGGLPIYLLKGLPMASQLVYSRLYENLTLRCASA